MFSDKMNKTIPLIPIMFLIGCASFQIATNPNVDVNSVKKIAVLPFANTPSQIRITGEWETLLLSLGYRVIERGNIDAILKEQGLSLSGLVDISEVPKIGDILGVEGFVIGRPNTREPYHSYNMMGKTKISEPPPTLVKLIEAKTARVIWNITSKDESAETLLISRQGDAVTDSIKSNLYHILKSANWNSFPSQQFEKSINGLHIAFNSQIFSRHKMRIGIYPFYAETKELGVRWADKMGGILLKSGYDVIERTQMENILAEQKISASGIIRQDDMIKLGKIAGLHGLIMGSIYGDPSCAYSIKLVDTQTGELYWSAYGEDCSASGLSEAISALLK
jgi:curli biogenesis system outer membrane secretion channel CsgG